MNLFKILVLLVAAICAGSAYADSPCGDSAHLDAQGKCVSDVQTAPLNTNTASEFGEAAKTPATEQQPEDIHKQEGQYEALSELEKERYEYLKNKADADRLQAELNPTGSPETRSNVPVYLTMVSGPNDALVGTMIYKNQVFKVQRGTLLDNGVTVTELHPTYALVNFNGSVQLVGLSTLGAIEEAKQDNPGSGVNGQQSGAPATLLFPRPEQPIPGSSKPINGGDLPPAPPSM